MRTPNDWQDVFLAIADEIAKRSKDDSFQAGAVLVDTNNRILGIGFNGPPPQINDAKVPWGKRPDKYDYIIHAEENAILNALDGHNGERLKGSTLYVNGHPCPGCVLRMIRAGVVRIVYRERGGKPKCVDDKAKETVDNLRTAVKGVHAVWDNEERKDVALLLVRVTTYDDSEPFSTNPPKNG